MKNKKTGEEAFLKALDFSSSAQSSDRLTAWKILVEAYLFERDLLLKCKTKKLNNISTPIAHGDVFVPGYSEFGRVYYLIFEKAEEGDVRNYLSKPSAFELRWCFASLHSIAVGIRQLHTNGIAHQDLKPSNVLIMNTENTKISDLGRASDSVTPSENDNRMVAGDRGYAPIDLWFEEIPIKGFERKFLTDIYLLGSLIYFFFTGVSAKQALYSKLTADQRINREMKFNELLPYLRDAFALTLEDLRTEIKKVAPDFVEDLIELVKQLCEPDPSQRGDPKWQRTLTPTYDLQRVISKLNIMVSTVRRN